MTDTISLTEAATLLEISVEEVVLLQQQGILQPARQEGTTLFFSRKDIEKIGSNKELTLSDEAEQVGIQLQRNIATSLSFIKRLLLFAGGSVAGYIALIGIFALLFALLPVQTARLLGYIPKPFVTSAENPHAKVLAASTSTLPAEQSSFLQALLQPISNASLGIVKYASPHAYEQIAKITILDPKDVLVSDQNGAITPARPMRFSGTSLEMTDPALIANLNSQYVQGKKPGTNPGDIAIVGANGTIDGLVIPTSVPLSLSSPVVASPPVTTTVYVSTNSGTTTVQATGLTDANFANDAAIANGHLANSAITLLAGNGISLTSNQVSLGGSVTISSSAISTISGLTTTNFASANLSQWTNDIGFITASADITGNAATATTANALANANSTGQSAITAINSATAGTINTARLNTAVTAQGNTFNGNSQLVQLDASGNLPALNGTFLTGLTKSQVGLSNVENTALSTWAGSANLNTIANQTVTLPRMANLAANSIIGNNTGSAATPIALTPAQVKSLLAIATGDISGLGTIATQNANNVSITGGTITGITGLTTSSFTSSNISQWTNNSGYITAASTDTLTNKTIAAGSNTISGLTAANLTAGDFSSKITSGTYGIDISGNAMTATTGNALANTNATGQSAISAINSATAGTINTARLSTSVTTQGNTFNGISQLLQLDSSGNLPAVGGAALTGLTKSQVGLSNVENTALSTWAGSTNLNTIANQTVTLPRMANLAANTIIGNNTGSAATPLALSSSQVKTLLSIATGDVSGLGSIATQNANNVSITGGSITGITGLTTSSFTSSNISQWTNNSGYITASSTDTLTNKTLAAGSNTISGLTNANLSGTAGITNANLANSSLTLTGNSGSGSVSLGGGLTLTGAGISNVTASGSTLTLTSTEADTLQSVYNRGNTLPTTTGSVANSYDAATINVGTIASTAQQNFSTLNIQNGGTGFLDLELVKGFINFQGMNTLYDDFTGRTLDTNKWTSTATGGGTSCGILAGGLNGLFEMISGNAASRGCELTTQTVTTLTNGYYQRGNNPIYETKLKINTLANARITAGFTDTRIAVANDTQASTNHAYILKRAADTAWQCATDDGGATDTITATGVTIVANTYYRLRVEVRNGTTPEVICTVDDGTTVTRTVVTTHLPGAASPMDVYTRLNQSDAVVKTLDVDYIRAWQDDPVGLSTTTPVASPSITDTPLEATPSATPSLEEKPASDSATLHNMVADAISTIVKHLVEFFGNVIFHGDVTFFGHETVSNDTAGHAVIKAGDREVHITFAKVYATIPVVTATVNVSNDILASQIPSYAISAISTNGFTITLSSATTTDLTFSWIALGVNETAIPTDTISDTPTISPTPSQEIFPTITLSPKPVATTGASAN